MSNRDGIYKGIIFALLFLALMLFVSCGKKASSQDALERDASPGQSKGIVIVKTNVESPVQKDEATFRSVVLNGDSDLSISAQLAQTLAGLASDPAVQAIVVSPAVKGTSALFQGIREIRPDLLLYAIESEDDYLEIEEAATFVVSSDQEANSYGAAWVAARLGCTRLVYVSSSPVSEGSKAALRRDVLLKAASGFKLEVKERYLVATPAPGKKPPVLPEGAALFDDPAQIAEMQGSGVKTAYYLADAAVVPAMLKAILRVGGVVTGMYPDSYLLQNPELVGAEPAGRDPGAIIAGLEKALAQQGAVGKLVVPGYPEGDALEKAVILSLQSLLAKNAKKPDSAQFMGFLKKATPSIAWRADYSMDRQTGVRSRNHLLVFQDLYLVGRGYLPFTKGQIPDSYRR